MRLMIVEKLKELRIEIERLKKFIDDYDVMEPVELRDVKRERDEALAQVAVLISHLREDDHTYGCRLCGCDLSDPIVSSKKARALLDRLQRAEAGGESVKALKQDHAKGGDHV